MGRSGHRRVIWLALAGAGLALALALLAGLVMSGPANVLAAGTAVNCTGNSATDQTSLQNALSAAPRDGSLYTITVSANCTIDLTSALAVGNDVNITLDGNGLTLAGDGSSSTPGSFYLFSINDSTASTLNLSQVTLKDGVGGIDDPNGLATVMLTDSAIDGSRSSQPFTAGIYAATVTLTNSAIDGVSASYNAAGIYAVGTAILTNSTVSGISGSSDPVGIHATTATLTGSTVSGVSDGTNSAGVGATTVTLTNSTISGISGFSAAGIGSQGTVTLIDSTVSGIDGSNGDSSSIDSVGIAAQTVNLTASIVADSGWNCLALSSLNDDGYNLSASPAGADTTCGFSNGSTHSRTVTDAQLDLQSLGNYGGPTETQALGTGSIAIDAIPVDASEQCLNAVGSPISDPVTSAPITSDQRGVTRPQGAGCDIGAFEVEQTTVTLGSSQCDQADLQTAVSGAKPYSLTTITMPANCTIDLTKSSLTVGAGVDITLNGNGLTLDGQNQNFDDIDINDGLSASTLALRQVTIENGSNGVADASHLATVTLTDCIVRANGNGGVYLRGITAGIRAGTVALINSSVTDNANGSTGAGGSGIEAGATVTVTNSIVSDNANAGSHSGEGSSGGYGINANAIVLTNSTVSNNATGSNADDIAGPGGIGIYANTSIIVTNSTVSGNGNGGYGGQVGGNGDSGIYASSVVLTDSTISGNGNSGNGGDDGRGIFANTATLTATLMAGNAHGFNCDVGTVNDGGYNLSASPDGTYDSCGFIANNSPTSAEVTDAAVSLLSLRDYGGPTPTIALGPGSAAIDAIPVYQGQCTLTAGTSDPILDPSTHQPITTDQRGIARPEGPKCDIGAYEAPAVAVTTTPGAASSSGWYNGSQLGAGGTLPVTVSYTGLATGELPSCSSAAITGLPSSAVDELNQTATGTASLHDGRYTLSCGVSQDSTSLGVSQSPVQPLNLQIDTAPPDGNCKVPNQGIWYNHNVAFGCAPTDATSGLAQSAPTSFNLTTNVASGSASANAATGSQQLCDVAGNCTMIGPYGFMIDLAPPTITSPVDGGAYLLYAQVPLKCGDVGSGVATCQVTVTLPDGTTHSLDGLQGQDLPTGQTGSYTVTPNTVTDEAGNADTTVLHYTVGYQPVMLPGSTTTVNRGYYALLRFYPADTNGQDDASRTLKVETVALDGPNGQTIRFVYPVQYGTFSGKAGYQLEINTRDLPAGSWKLEVQFGSGINETDGWLPFTVVG